MRTLTIGLLAVVSVAWVVSAARMWERHASWNKAADVVELVSVVDHGTLLQFDQKSGEGSLKAFPGLPAAPVRVAVVDQGMYAPKLRVQLLASVGRAPAGLTFDLETMSGPPGAPAYSSGLLSSYGLPSVWQALNSD